MGSYLQAAISFIISDSTIVLIAAVDSTFSIVTTEMNLAVVLYILLAQLSNCHWPDQAVVVSTSPGMCVYVSIVKCIYSIHICLYISAPV